MSSIERNLHNSEAEKSSVGVVQREQTFAAIPEPKYPANNLDVPGRTLGAKPEWTTNGTGATYRCTCGSVTTWNELPVVDMLRGKLITANCCSVGRSNSFNPKPVEHARIEHKGLEVRS